MTIVEHPHPTGPRRSLRAPARVPARARVGSAAPTAWTELVATAVLLGLAAPAAAILVSERSGAVPLGVLVTGGLAQGAVLGWAQARALRRMLPRFDPAAWIRASASGTAATWFLVLVAASSSEQWTHWSPPWLGLAGAAAGAALLGGTGCLQARTLVGTVAHPYRWAGWWALALVTGAAAALAVADAARAAGTLAAGALAACALATVVAAVSGAGARNLARQDGRRP